jgi:hypothetical protein
MRSDSSVKAPGRWASRFSAPRSLPTTNNWMHNMLAAPTSPARRPDSGQRGSPGRSSTRMVSCSYLASMHGPWRASSCRSSKRLGRSLVAAPAAPG